MARDGADDADTDSDENWCGAAVKPPAIAEDGDGDAEAAADGRWRWWWCRRCCRRVVNDGTMMKAPPTKGYAGCAADAEFDWFADADAINVRSAVKSLPTLRAEIFGFYTVYPWKRRSGIKLLGLDRLKMKVGCRSLAGTNQPDLFVTSTRLSLFYINNTER